MKETRGKEEEKQDDEEEEEKKKGEKEEEEEEARKVAADDACHTLDFGLSTDLKKGTRVRAAPTHF